MNPPWNFIGIRREKHDYPYPRMNFLRWRIPFIGRGAIGTHGSGHWSCLGVHYGWVDNAYFGYSKSRHLNVFGLIRIDHEERNELKSVYPGWRVSFAKLQTPIRRII